MVFMFHIIWLMIFLFSDFIHSQMFSMPIKSIKYLIEMNFSTFLTCGIKSGLTAFFIKPKQPKGQLLFINYCLDFTYEIVLSFSFVVGS